MTAPDRIGLIQDDFLDGMWALASADEADVSVHYLRATPAREAAPDLLEALETACSALVFADGLLAGSGSSSVVIDVAIEEARAAIAKAKGGAE